MFVPIMIGVIATWLGGGGGVRFEFIRVITTRRARAPLTQRCGRSNIFLILRDPNLSIWKPAVGRCGAHLWDAECNLLVSEFPPTELTHSLISIMTRGVFDKACPSGLVDVAERDESPCQSCEVLKFLGGA